MRLTTRFLGALSYAAIACWIAPSHDRPHLGRGKSAEHAPKAQTIPIESIFTTGPQKELKANCVRPAFETLSGKEIPSTSYSTDLQAIESEGKFAPNMFLVRGNDITGAIQSTRRTLMAGYPADEPPQPNPNN